MEEPQRPIAKKDLKVTQLTEAGITSTRDLLNNALEKDLSSDPNVDLTPYFLKVFTTARNNEILTGQLLEQSGLFETFPDLEFNNEAMFNLLYLPTYKSSSTLIHQSEDELHQVAISIDYDLLLEQAHFYHEQANKRITTGETIRTVATPRQIADSIWDSCRKYRIYKEHKNT